MEYLAIRLHSTGAQSYAYKERQCQRIVCEYPRVQASLVSAYHMYEDAVHQGCLLLPLDYHSRKGHAMIDERSIQMLSSVEVAASDCVVASGFNLRPHTLGVKLLTSC